MTKKRRVLVIGGTSGVGEAVVHALFTEGSYSITVLGRNEDKLAMFKQMGINTIAFDLLSDSPLPSLNYDILCFSAGVGRFEAAEVTSDASIEQMLRTNVEVPIRWTREAIPWMKKNGGQLIYIGSQAGFVPTPKAATYAASKHALIGYTRALRMELKDDAIPVSVIHPGPINTPFIDAADATGTYKASLGRWLIEPEEVAKAVQQVIKRPKKEVHLPRIMKYSSKLYQLMPSFVERVGRSWFEKK